MGDRQPHQAGVGQGSVNATLSASTSAPSLRGGQTLNGGKKKVLTVLRAALQDAIDEHGPPLRVSNPAGIDSSRSARATAVHSPTMKAGPRRTSRSSGAPPKKPPL